MRGATHRPETCGDACIWLDLPVLMGSHHHHHPRPPPPLPLTRGCVSFWTWYCLSAHRRHIPRPESAPHRALWLKLSLSRSIPVSTQVIRGQHLPQQQTATGVPSSLAPTALLVPPHPPAPALLRVHLGFRSIENTQSRCSGHLWDLNTLNKLTGAAPCSGLHGGKMKCNTISHF